MNSERKHAYSFKSFRLDIGERQLLDDNKPVPLTPKAFDVLAFLVERGGHLVEKEELMQAVWSDSFVEESNISRLIHTLRRALGEDHNGSKFIETVATKGYRFVAQVNEVSEPGARDLENGKPGAQTLVEELPEAELQTSSAAIDIAVVQPIDKPKHTTRVILFSFGFLAAVFLIGLLSFHFRSASSVRSSDVRSIAVLPLRSLSSENRDDIYELGIADASIQQLSVVRGLTVRAISSVRKYRDVEQDAVEAGKEQKVDVVLTSNYQVINGRFRITSQLINVESGSVEETFSFDDENSDKLATEDAVCATVGKRLLAKLNMEPVNLAVSRGTTNEEAYRLYLQGMNFADKRNPKDERRAIELFEQSVNLDPAYAHAYAGLAYARSSLPIVGGGDAEEENPKAIEAVDRALALDPNLAEAYSILGMIQGSYEWDRVSAEKSLRRAVELEPNSSFTHRFYSVYLTNSGRHDEAIAEMKTAIDLDPNLIWNQKLLGRALFLARRYDEAITQFLSVNELDPSHREGTGYIYDLYALKGDYERAYDWWLKHMAKTGSTEEEINSWKIAYAESGWPGILRRRYDLDEQDEKQGGKKFVEMSRIATELGEKDKAFAYTNKAFAYLENANLRGGQVMDEILVNPHFDSLRTDPRFDQVLKRAGYK